jgi:hypothetical protein
MLSQRYLAIEHLSLALLGTRKGRIAMFTAYFDASGDSHTRVVTVAGFMADADKWLAFEKDWSDTLEEFGIPYLHMREFAHFKGPYEKFKSNEPLRRWLLQRLCGIISSNVITSTCVNVRVQAFNHANIEYPVREAFGTPLAIAGVAAVAVIADWHKQTNNDFSKCLLVFEHGDAEAPSLTNALDKYHNAIPIYRRKTDHVEFQAADWLAYEHRRASSDWIDQQKPMAFRKSMGMLLESLPSNTWGDIGIRQIRGICELYKIPTFAQIRAMDVDVQS